jgi:hypothetical protein
MKIRIDFITNSSSSSFVLISASSNKILVDAITNKKLKEYVSFFHSVLEKNEILTEEIENMIRSWHIEGPDPYGNYHFFTSMDNYPLGEVLSEIGGCVYYTE